MYTYNQVLKITQYLRTTHTQPSPILHSYCVVHIFPVYVEHIDDDPGLTRSQSGRESHSHTQVRSHTDSHIHSHIHTGGMYNLCTRLCTHSSWITMTTVVMAIKLMMITGSLEIGPVWRPPWPVGVVAGTCFPCCHGGHPSNRPSSMTHPRTPRSPHCPCCRPGRPGLVAIVTSVGYNGSLLGGTPGSPYYCVWNIERGRWWDNIASSI